MIKTHPLPIIILIVSIVTACSNVADLPPTEMVGVNVESTNWNSSFKIIDDPVLSNSRKNGEVLTLRIENLSNTKISFSEDFGVKIITKVDDNWIIIQNNFFYTFQKILPTKESYPLGLVVTTLPNVPGLTSSIKIRILIIGYAENANRIPLGAFLDVTLNP